MRINWEPPAQRLGLLADLPLNAGIIAINAIPGSALQHLNDEIADFLELSDPESTTSPGGCAQANCGCHCGLLLAPQFRVGRSASPNGRCQPTLPKFASEVAPIACELRTRSSMQDRQLRAGIHRLT
jgi:hypothetical protein